MHTQFTHKHRLVVSFLLSFTSAAYAASPNSAKVALEFKSLPSGSPKDVIIRFWSEPTAADIAQIEARGAKAKVLFKHVRTGVFSLRASAVADIAGQPNVAYISPDRKVTGFLEYAQPAVGGDIAYQYSWT